MLTHRNRCRGSPSLTCICEAISLSPWLSAGAVTPSPWSSDILHAFIPNCSFFPSLALLLNLFPVPLIANLTSYFHLTFSLISIPSRLPLSHFFYQNPLWTPWPRGKHLPPPWLHSLFLFPPLSSSGGSTFQTIKKTLPALPRHRQKDRAEQGEEALGLKATRQARGSVILVCSRCNRGLHPEWLKQWKCFVSQSWNPGVWGQGVSRAGSSHGRRIYPWRLCPMSLPQLLVGGRQS